MTISPRDQAGGAGAAPWLKDEFLRPAPTDGYGYLGDGPPRPCTIEELRAAILRIPRERIYFVWTPGRGRMIPVAEAPELFEAVRGAELSRVGEILREKPAWAVLAAAGIWWLGPRTGMSLSWLAMMWTAFLGLPIVDALIRGVGWKRATVAETRARGEDSRFQHWLAWQRASKTTHVIIGTLVVTWLLAQQAGARQAVAVFAMDEAGVRAGGWWRPLTCFFLHGDMAHLIFNCLALSQLGRWVELMTQAAWVPVILLFATLGGSLAGYVLPPDVPSVGASGGILGLLGFLIMISGPRERQVPRSFLRLLWQWVIFVALLGLIGWTVIDNAAHLGGLMTGAVLGAVANATLPAGPPPVRAQWVRIPGLASAAVLALAGVWMTWVFWQAGQRLR